MTIHHTRFSEAPPPKPRVLQVVVDAEGGRGYLVHTWVLNAEAAKYDQQRPEKRPTLAAALALKPLQAEWYPVPGDFALTGWAWS